MRWPAKRISESSKKSLGMYTEAMSLASGGIDIIHLEVGRPDADTPQHIKDATKDALDDGLVHYGHPAGNAVFRQSIAAKLAEYNAIFVEPDEIIVTNGLTHAAYITCMAALDPGDEVILLEPYYPQHINKIELAGAVVVTAPLDKSRNFRIDENAIRSKITPRTRMISLVNPVNPTGRVYSREELLSIVRIAEEYDLLVMSDEVYEQIVYDGRRHLSIASLPGMAQRTISHFAFTKVFAMDGWRLGYLAAARPYIDALMKVSLNDVTHVNVFIQEGGRAAITGPQDSRLQMLQEDCRRRDLVCARLNEIPGVHCPVPEGTIYAFPDISGLGISDVDLARGLLNDKHVAVEAGSFYGAAGKGHLRICFGSEPFERVEIAMNRIIDYIKGGALYRVSGT
jgi:aspartate aminotransferase